MAVIPVRLVLGVRAFRYPKPRPGWIIEEAAVAYDKPRSTSLLSRQRAAKGLTSVSDPGDSAVIFNNQVAVALQFYTEQVRAVNVKQSRL